MKIAHRLMLGSGLPVAMLMVVVAYQTRVVADLEALHRKLTVASLPAASLLVTLDGSIEEQESLVRKIFAIGRTDPGYAASYRQKLERVRHAFASSLASVERIEMSATQSAARARVAAVWNGHATEAQALLAKDPAASDGRGLSSLGLELAELSRLDHLREALQSLERATEVENRQRRAQALGAGARLERTNRALLIAALVSSLVIGTLTSRSINRSLGRLIAAANAVADGRFSYQLDTGGNHELSLVARAFDAMTRRLETLDRMKKDFVARVSHDLRAPLVAIQESTDLLLAGLVGPLGEQQVRLLRLNRESGRRLGSRIANLLALSRFEAGVFALDIRRHELGELVRFTLREVLLPARRRGLSLHVDLPSRPIEVRCDQERMTQVLENLLDNAIKYTPRAGQMEVAARANPGPPAARGSHQNDERPRRPWPASGHIEILVANSGPGIAPADRQRVFASFYRKGTAAATSGCGLGLAICHDLVAAHDGAVWIDGRSGGGVRVHIALPWQPAPAMDTIIPAASGVPRATAGSPSKPRLEPRR